MTENLGVLSFLQKDTISRLNYGNNSKIIILLLDNNNLHEGNRCNITTMVSLLLLLSFLLSAQQVSPLQFDVLETPFVDALSTFLCDETADGAFCSVLGAIVGNETDVEDVDTESGQTLGQFLRGAACSVGLVPPLLCDDDEEEADIGANSNATNNTVPVFEEEETLVDGFVMGLACGEDGSLPDILCNVLVGEDANSGLISSLCASGRLIPSSLCEQLGAETPAGDEETEQDSDFGGRYLRHR